MVRSGMQMCFVYTSQCFLLFVFFKKKFFVNTKTIGDFSKSLLASLKNFDLATPDPCSYTTASSRLGMRFWVPQAYLAHFVHFHPLATVDTGVCNPFVIFSILPQDNGALERTHIPAYLSFLCCLHWPWEGGFVWACELRACLSGSFMSAEGGRRASS